MRYTLGSTVKLLVAGAVGLALAGGLFYGHKKEVADESREPEVVLKDFKAHDIPGKVLKKGIRYWMELGNIRIDDGSVVTDDNRIIEMTGDPFDRPFIITTNYASSNDVVRY